MTRILAISAVVAGALLALPASAQEGVDLLDGPTNFNIDNQHTLVLASWDHVGLSTTWGAFKTVGGTVTLDPDAIENSKLSVNIDVASFDALWPDRTADVISANYLNSPAHPQATYVSTSVERTGDSTARVTGDLTLNGTTVPVTLDVTLNKIVERNDTIMAGFDATGKVARSAFGITGALPFVGDEITLTISSELVLAE